MKRPLHRNPAPLAAMLLLALAAAGAQAQGIYRIVGPDGRVTFSDKPPTQGDKAMPLSADGRGGRESGGGSTLPYELRQIASRYPVTLYSGANCAPCDSGRQLLVARGIPYSERTISTAQDIEALQKISTEAALPVLTIGGQRLLGFVEADWSQYLDAAGYPKASQLPPGYRNPDPAPLAPQSKPIPANGTGAAQPGPAAPTAPAAREAAPPAAPATNPGNPAGIIF